MDSTFVVVSAVSDDPFAIDVAHYIHQEAEISDLLALRKFANTEFCPRFISDEEDLDHIGHGLDGKTVAIVSTCCGPHTRNALAMRTCVVARAAKDNGAKRVILVQPDLFYSAQDRGPRREHGVVAFERSTSDYKKFDGQPFSALLYAQLLQTSGVDGVITVHNHSVSVQALFRDIFDDAFLNLSPAELYSHYLTEHALGPNGTESSEFVICAPDKGAAPFVNEVHAGIESASARLLLKTRPELLFMTKVRRGERSVRICAADDSPTQLSGLAGKVVVVFDDMVRTGNTIVECCKVLKEAGASRVLFVVTHFHSSDEVKENLNHEAIDEIITTNTLPEVLNRDMQGRLRKKMLVLKIEKWIGNFLSREFADISHRPHDPPYSIDISAKNPRWRPIHSLGH
ncbi:MAG: ribose-phosphate pyrophosphokinase [Lentisphaerae bacterium]|jgi:ribose-phosphate pyrophosphokinase|nr:ribose-phosphate pyrophosphokinase [Lentisphaerota bacterium]MBT4819880.1 ribose-phosphate pyrophosphokinase [Lentisphaerota bacterium]MBT5605080.1 ribose-phosphate pyrophosphokinase [Lentisphaerota bacterium]MBT7062235.1 ribose-phosphate pyrophosphokinase [Lentisphaerota bacterium]MBT7847043.1 ribose-phosphate pyrophosphokinase [Lentisphaerota bacterium]